MRVVVTGATGNVGTSVLRALSREDGIESILGIARRRPTLQVAKTTAPSRRWLPAALERILDAGGERVQFRRLGPSEMLVGDGFAQSL